MLTPIDESGIKEEQQSFNNDTDAVPKGILSEHFSEAEASTLVTAKKKKLRAVLEDTKDITLEHYSEASSLVAAKKKELRAVLEDSLN